MFANCRSPFLLDSLGRCLYLSVSSDSTLCHVFTSQFGLANFFREKLQTPRLNRVARTSVYKWPATGIVWPASKRVRPTTTESWLGARTHRKQRSWVGVGVCVFASVSVCARACVHVCVRDVFAICDNDILPRLIMKIIKIIILYFIQIRHTDDFP